MTPTIKDIQAEIIEKTAEEVTDYGYNDEYGYYNDWKEEVRPIIAKAITQTAEAMYRDAAEVARIVAIDMLGKDDLASETREQIAQAIEAKALTIKDTKKQ